MDLADLSPPPADLAPPPSPPSPASLTLGGLPYKVRRLRLSDMARLEAWLKRTVPHPVDAVKPHLEGLAPSERELLVQNADRLARYWPPEYGSAAANAHFATADGVVELLTVGLQVCQPSITREQVALLADEMSMEELGRVIDIFNGVDRAKMARETAEAESANGASTPPK